MTNGVNSVANELAIFFPNETSLVTLGGSEPVMSQDCGPSCRRVSPRLIFILLVHYPLSSPFFHPSSARQSSAGVGAVAQIPGVSSLLSEWASLGRVSLPSAFCPRREATSPLDVCGFRSYLSEFFWGRKR